MIARSYARGLRVPWDRAAPWRRAWALARRANLIAALLGMGPTSREERAEVRIYERATPRLMWATLAIFAATAGGRNTRKGKG